ncbi:MAG TPA: hypothetical protein VHV30_02595 [Polyangiaceae bacterium]|jgi:hypothetical protein|nr:hypothetical protein [Polyangiaceae bacterium]
MGKKSTKGQVVVSAKQLIEGTAKRLANATQVEFMGTSYTPAQLASSLQQLVDLRADVDAAKATTRAKLAAESTQGPPLRVLMNAYVAYLRVTFGHSQEALADFGITSKTRATPSSEAKTAAVAKRKATRAARHTMGPRQKMGIHGNVTGVTVTPIVTTPVVTPPRTS